MSTVTGTIAAHSVLDFSDEETEAGPSLNYAERQAVTLRKLTMEFQCTACTDRVSRGDMVTAQCGHRYCADCMKSLFMRSTKDEGLYPPKCCKIPIPLALVARHMDANDLSTFQLAAVEFATQHRVYCSNLNCAKFIVPDNIKSGLQRADCAACGTETCAICMNGYHYSRDCPDDPSLHQTRELAKSLGWQTCGACNRVVQLRSGCNHMTCICKAEFCYVCGIKWKNCACEAADINRIEERAEEIVERDAPADMLPHQRRARFDQVFVGLQNNHECEHSRQFQRIDSGAPRRGFRCEMCDARHYRYILQCRLCYVNVCEECRRHRI
ncbi:ariadne RING finger [Pyrenochaeta sp. DS3sAY3a]|nr:ariadne RING finger [Pyrenochaeta sp. DS3sAY3a]